MEERVLKLRVGVVVLAAAIITSILVMRIGDMPLPGTSKYTLYINFTRAPGVQVGTPVRKSGISIGRVTNVELMDNGGVQVTADIDSRRKIFVAETCHINTASVLGDPVLEFVLGDKQDPGAAVLVDGNEIDGVVTGNPLEVIVALESDLKAALGSIRAAGDEVKLAARNVNTAVANSSDDIPRVMREFEDTLTQMRTTFASVNDVVGDPELRKGLRTMMSEVPALVSEARGTLTKANATFDSFAGVGKRAEQNLANLEAFTKPLADRGPQMVNNIDGILENVNDLTENLNDFSSGLNARDGTIGKLMHDDTIYRRLDRTLANAEDLTLRMRPILDDVRVFTDKIARDPRQLGVKGALDRRPLGMGNKLPTTPDVLSRDSAASYESETYYEPAPFSSDSNDQTRLPPSPLRRTR